MENPPYVLEHEYDDETPPSIAVVQALSVLTNVDPVEAPTELGFVLHEHINPEALDTILTNGSRTGEIAISFEVSNDETYIVEINDSGSITVRHTS